MYYPICLNKFFLRSWIAERKSCLKIYLGSFNDLCKQVVRAFFDQEKHRSEELVSKR